MENVGVEEVLEMETKKGRRKKKKRRRLHGLEAMEVVDDIWKGKRRSCLYIYVLNFRKYED